MDKYNFIDNSTHKNQDVINAKSLDNQNWVPVSVENTWIQNDISKMNKFASSVLQPGAMWPTVLPQLNFSMFGVNAVSNLLQPSDVLMSSMRMINNFTPPSQFISSQTTTHATLAPPPPPPIVPTFAAASVANNTTSSTVHITSVTTASSSATTITTDTTSAVTTATVATASATVIDDTARISLPIQCKNCNLVPPNPDFPPRTTREKPPGCKTIFVGGLTESTTEDVLRDIFERCGEILAIRISPKRFCHIKFSEESSVDKAVSLSGYMIKFNDSTVSNRFHVDYAQARDDQHEWECKQRQLKREMRHRYQLQERFNEIPVGIHYTENEAGIVIEKLKGDKTFIEAIPIAVYWLERGECTRRNANFFFTMIQTCTSHIRRLINEKKDCEEEFRRTKEQIRVKVQEILHQVGELEKLFVSSSHKKVWDHFTKPQRKIIDSWKKYATELKNWDLDSGIAADNEMDVSDSEDHVPIKKVKDSIQETNSLKDENDNLRCQLEAFKNEIHVIRVELQSEIDKKANQIASLMQAYNSMQEKYEELVVEKVKLELKYQEQNSESFKIQKDQDTDLEEEQKSDIANNSCKLQDENSSTLTLETEARILGLISIFLHVHPFGVGIDYICSYLEKFVPSVRTSTVEDIMNKFTLMFQQDVNGVGVNMERRWKFVGFKCASE